MKKIFICIVFILNGLTSISNAQIVRIGEHAVHNNESFYIQEVSPNEYLQISYGLDAQSRGLTVSYLDSSIYKKVIYPVYNGDSLPRFRLALEGIDHSSSASSTSGRAFPATRTVFNQDTLLEFLLQYKNLPSSPHVYGDYLIINENGQIVDSLINYGGGVYLYPGPGYTVLGFDTAHPATSTFKKVLYKLNRKLSTTAIKIDALPEMFIYPNPFNTEVRIGLENIVRNESSFISIRDSQGREIDRINSIHNQEQVIWKPKQIEKGYYLISVFLDGAVISKASIHLKQ